jgi:hypothetical protein
VIIVISVTASLAASIITNRKTTTTAPDGAS